MTDRVVPLRAEDAEPTDEERRGLALDAMRLRVDHAWGEVRRLRDELWNARVVITSLTVENRELKRRLEERG